MIISNFHRRDLISAFEMTTDQQTKLRGEFDWMTGEEFGYSMFFEYRGDIYALSEFSRLDGELLEQGWQGYLGQTSFSSLLIRIEDSAKSVIVGTHLS